MLSATTTTTTTAAAAAAGGTTTTADCMQALTHSTLLRGVGPVNSPLSHSLAHPPTSGRSLVCVCARRKSRSVTPSYIVSIRSSVPSFRSFLRRQFVPLLLRSVLPPSSIRSFNPSFFRSFVPSFRRQLAPLFLRSFAPSLLHSPVPSFLRSMLYSALLCSVLICSNMFDSPPLVSVRGLVRYDVAVTFNACGLTCADAFLLLLVVVVMFAPFAAVIPSQTYIVRLFALCSPHRRTAITSTAIINTSQRRCVIVPCLLSCM